MGDYNEIKQCFCKYCGKECKNKNSLLQHEVRCKLNENRIPIYLPYNVGNGGKTKGYITINKDNVEKHVSKDKLDEYINNGWKLGCAEHTLQKIKETSKSCNHPGKCSDEIKENDRKKRISESMKGNTNWKFNKRHGNGKKGHYKGIYCDSTWELAFLVFYTEHNLFIERTKEKREYVFNNEVHMYCPDFKTDEGVIEVKGRIDKKAIAKHEQHPDIIVYDKYKMKEILEYVTNKYGKEYWKVLYDK